jgi:DNA-binding NarL/FixJ family response regulator
MQTDLVEIELKDVPTAVLARELVRRRKARPRSDYEGIAEDHAKGMKLGEIAEKRGITTRTVRRALKGAT